jgi:hypothetical protein
MLNSPLCVVDFRFFLQLTEKHTAVEYLLVKHRLPVGLVYGVLDDAAPPEFNAEIIRELYEAADAPIKTWARQLYGHHPHGLEDPQPLLDYIEEVAL